MEVTEEVIAKALEGSIMKTLQNSVSLPMIKRYVKMLESGSLPPAIKVADGVIIDGNHRYVAGRILGVEPPMGVEPPINTGFLVSSQYSRIIPIQKVKISLLDWGGY
jgi:hypothetical protein